MTATKLRVLSESALRDEESGDLRVVIETSKGSRNKFSYDPKCACFQLSHVLPEGMLFPFDFGFLPSTLADDGDPLDVLALTDAPVPTGAVIRARLVGVIEARQKKPDSDWYRNDRLIAIATHARSHEGINNLKDLRPHVLRDFEAFFEQYNRLRGRTFEVLACHGPKKARKLVKQGEKRFHKSR